MSFHVGQKVTKVDSAPWLTESGNSVDGSPSPKFGVVYTVTSVRQHPVWGGPYLCLAEFSHFYLASCFRPVVEHKTDISIFIRMLDPALMLEPVA